MFGLYDMSGVMCVGYVRGLLFGNVRGVCMLGVIY